MDLFTKSAWAQDGGAATGMGFSGLILPLVLFGALYFLLIRPQANRAKQHAAMVSELGKGDEVVTAGGVLGKITELGDQFIKIRISANTEIQVQRSTIGAIVPKGTMKD